MTLRKLAIVVLMLAASSIAAAELRYTVEELSPPPGAVHLEASDINDRGQVVGAALFPGGMTAPVLWDRGMPALIGGDDDSPFGYSNSINERGHAAVTWWNDIQQRRLAVVRPDGRQELRPLSGVTSSGSGVMALNDQDHAVGFSIDAGGRNHAVLWRGGAVLSLGIKGEEGTMARDIDNADRIVGIYVANDVERAFRWRHGRLSWLEPLQEGSHSAAVALNNHGQAVGGATNAAGRARAVTWLDTQPLELQPLERHHSSGAADINDAGAIIGWSFTVEEGAAVLWQDGGVFELNELISSDSEWWLYQAHAINNLGQVIGRGSRDGLEAIYLLTPVPEPSCVAMGIVCWAMGARRRTSRS